VPDGPFLLVRNLRKTYVRRPWWGSPSAGVAAVRGVDLSLERGRTFGLVGPSGSGKSTVARCLARLELPDAGEILLEGRAPRAGEIQMIFQDAAASLNPRLTAAQIVAEPLLIQRRGTAQSRRALAAQWLENVGLSPNSADRRALHFSGGERQRLAIARALVLKPCVLILDESFTGLDLPLQQQMAALLLDLQRKLALTAVLISHDLDLMGLLAGEIAVMDDGLVVEQGPAAELLEAPRHPLTRKLVAASRALSLEGR
jgi:peptide/nickel transport system ATP-binding protein